MSQKTKKWFKSAFQEEFPSHCPSSTKKFRQDTTVDLTQDDDDNENLPLSAATSNALNKIPSKNNKTINPSSSNWMEHFEPKVLADLAVHAKKIVEVQDWFRHYDVIKNKYPGQMLLITGPAGSGKTATVKVLAKELKYELVEWITPVDMDLVKLARNGQSSFQDSQETYRESQAEVFKQFLFKSSRYKYVFESMQRRIILVEDFPNVFVRDSDGFSELLLNYREYGKSPIIFIVTDSKSKQLNLAYNLFPDSVKGKHQIAHISFNSVSSTLMKKALTRICNLMQNDSFNKFYKVPTPNIVESINVSSQGDIRNAVINLHFASLKGATNVQMNISTKSSSNKATKRTKGSTLKSIGRDESITLMHALGRAFNPKYEENTKPVKFLHSPEEITDAFSSEPKMFVNFLQSNHLAHFGTIESALNAADNLSLSDILLAEYREDSVGHLGLNIAIRGLMVSNVKPVSGWLPVKGIKYVENRRNTLQTELAKCGVKYELSPNVLVSDYRTYARIIKAAELI